MHTWPINIVFSPIQYAVGTKRGLPMQYTHNNNTSYDTHQYKVKQPSTLFKKKKLWGTWDPPHLASTCRHPIKISHCNSPIPLKSEGLIVGVRVVGWNHFTPLRSLEVIRIFIITQSSSLRNYTTLTILWKSKIFMHLAKRKEQHKILHQTVAYALRNKERCR